MVQSEKSRKKLLLFIIVFVLLLITPLVIMSLNKQDKSQMKQATTVAQSKSAFPSTSQTRPNLAQAIARSEDSTVFADAINTLNYDSILETNDPYTVFVPSDAAYKNLPPQTAQTYVNYENEDYLRMTLEYHIVKGTYLTKDFKDGMKLKTYQGEDITITKDGDYWVLNGYAYIDTPDVQFSNGVTHAVTNFVFPPSLVKKKQ